MDRLHGDGLGPLWRSAPRPVTAAVRINNGLPHDDVGPSPALRGMGLRMPDALLARYEFGSYERGEVILRAVHS